MSSWVEIAGATLLLVGAGATLAMAIARSAKRADERVERLPELAHIALKLRSLRHERSASGRRFFPTPQSRRELAERVYDALEND
jgi:hypothetical protein